MAKLTRESIPRELLAAKTSALGSYFALEQEDLPTAFAAHPRPKHNVVGIGIGYKVSNGKTTTNQCVHFYVEKKLPKGAIPDEHMLPAKIGGVLTDVIETGRFRAYAGKPKEQQKKRPAQPGCSVGFAFSGAQAGNLMAGTFGALAAKDGKHFVLSNNHVLANENALPIGSPIFQPGLLDLNDPGPDQIAKLSNFVKLQAGQPNKVDCAIAEVSKDSLVSASVMPKVGKLKSGQPVTATVGMAVEKTGRTTSYTSGKIIDVSANIKVNYDIGLVAFTDQVLIVGNKGKFSDAGDSGSLIVEIKTKRPAALLFAGSPTHTIANHIADVLGALNVTIVA